ncbi:DUF4249 domain-containing protein [Flavobacterium sp. MDT1-60]|uniref:DUF4249 domain-containing protein n=1 Tax=Flavobacterium sp. MDT1-60 TaxID=1979344 RepID=UPI001780B3CA|nr:DUF4249 domain-containing protein [Flavobacterium sp. MDT1-60]QOG02758.1 DUF4249 domain-containing protein [Flavobacterium sp. MDT1-60]
MKVLFRFLTILILSTTAGCTTPYDYQTNGFDDVITIEATITDQFKTQEIKLTRTYKLEEKVPTFETKAIVFVTDDKGNKYDFKENAGTYTSINQFQASPDRTYELHIRTQDGRSYISNAEKLPQQTQIESVNADAITKAGVLGVEITVNSTDPTNSSKYYRYEYEETSQIIAPKYYPEMLVANNGRVTFQPRNYEARICYTTEKSNTLLLTSTSHLSEDKVSNFPVRFISSKDKFIRNRYSILVKQYVQSLAAHTFSETLKEISATGSILSQTQPGFFYGNIQSETNPSEKVIGYFDVSSYSEKRIFFSFTELFPKEPKPQYQYECPSEIPESDFPQYFFNYCFSTNPNAGCQGNLIVEYIRTRIKVFFPNEGNLYLLYPIECGDCTSFSSNIKPSFWID